MYNSSILNVGAGLLFGLGMGFVTAMIGVNIGATVAFYLSRKFIRDRAAKKVNELKLFQVLHFDRPCSLFVSRCY